MQSHSWRKKFGAACHGIYLVCSQERSFSVHLLTTLLVIVAGVYYRVTQLEWCLLVGAIVSVLSLELMNSAVERLAKAITREHNEWIGAALDCAAGAVLLASGGAVVVGLLIFVPKLGLW